MLQDTGRCQKVPLLRMTQILMNEVFTNRELKNWDADLDVPACSCNFATLASFLLSRLVRQ